jgi:hypothetical protein
MYNTNNEYYPTPQNIIDKMLSDIDFSYINSILEPSAGQGNIVKVLYDKMDYRHNNYSHDRKQYNPDIDCIEINENFRHILKGKGYKVVHDDFLTYETYKQYDLIVANPPFSDGDKHLLKMLDMQKNGGNIVCLLNAETIKNPHSNRRKELIQRLTEYNANITYIENAFYDAERKTDVKIALIKIHIPEAEKSSYIYEQLKQEKEVDTTEYQEEYYSLIQNDFIKAIVDQYNLEVKAGSLLIKEYYAMKPYILSSFEKDETGEVKKNVGSILNLCLNGADRYSKSVNVNDFIKKVRYKYWKTLFENKEFIGKLTNNLQQDYYKRVAELQEYDFSLYNIYTLNLEMSKNVVQGIEETILALFDEFSRKHYWDAETCSNIHYYNGWKTNSCWKINKKIIIPLVAFRDMEYSWGRYEPSHYTVVRKLEDIEKVFNYLDGGLTEEVNLQNELNMAEITGETKKIPLKYFMVTFYKKGTCHIEFTNDDLLKKFNLFGSQRKGWLPPSYGKKAYTDMSREEKAVVDSYEGQQEYNKVINNKQYYLVESSQLLQLGA